MSTSSPGKADAVRSTPRRRAWPGIAILALAPLWWLGMFDRGLWTPDEPREADIIWRMSLQSDRSIPHLAGAAFLEKPPLTYWLGAASISGLGDCSGCARLPNLLYALLAAAAIAMLAARMAGKEAALVAALVAGSALLSYRVAVWLAPDAALLAGSALALLGAYTGYTSAPGARKFGGYTLMHAGAAFGFMAKSAPGWLVPALALAALIAWERRWSELRRWELYAGLALQGLLIAPWIAAVAATPTGAEALRTLFWDNLAGRFTALAPSPGHDYAQGHINWWGKYLTELPAYLFPWTLLGAAALARARHEVRGAAAAADTLTTATAWRFAVCASLPFLALLSLAATARDVYAAPAVLGFALLVALWAKALRRAAAPLDEVCLKSTRVLVAIFAGVLAAALALLASVQSELPRALADVAAALTVVCLTFIALRIAARLQRSRDYGASIGAIYAAYALAFVTTGVLALPVVDRGQDLGALAQRIEQECAASALAVLNPDETTIAMLDHRGSLAFTILAAAPGEAGQVIAAWFRAHGERARVLIMLPGHAPGELSRLIARWHRLAPPADGIAQTLAASGEARISERYELPQGRRYALLAAAPPRAATPAR